MFVADIAANRGISLADVSGERFGEGRVFFAQEAVSRGMADRVETLQQAVTRLQSPEGRSAVMGGASTRLSTPQAVFTGVTATLDNSSSTADADLADRVARLEGLVGWWAEPSPAPAGEPPTQPDPLAEFDIEKLAGAFAAHMEEAD